MAKKYSFNSILCSAFLVSAFSCQPLLAHVNMAALGAPSARTSHYKSGVYLGVQEGLSYMSGRISDAWDPNDPLFNTTPHSSDKSVSNATLISEVMIGGRYLCASGFFPGAEIAFSFANHRLTNTFFFTEPNLGNLPGLFNPTFERRSVIIPSLVLGWAFKNNFHVFAKFGLGISRFKTKVSVVENNNLHEIKSFSKNETKYSFAPSIGVEYALSPHFSIIGTLSYERYKESQLISRANTGGAPDDINRFRVKPSIFTQKIGLLIKI